MPYGEARRVYQLAIGDGTNDEANSQHAKDDYDMSYVDELQMAANINYTDDKSKGGSDDTTIEIYNMTPEMRKKFNVAGSTVMLRAGYDEMWKRDDNGDIVKEYDEIPIIYVGSVLQAYSQKRGQDIITTVHCSSDKVERSVTRISTSYAPNTKRKDVINDLVKQLKLPVVEVDTTPCDNLVYAGGLAVYGRVADELTRICEENGLVWFTHNRQVRVLPANSAPKNLAWEIHPFNVIDTVEGYYKRTQTKPKKVSAATHPRGHAKKKKKAAEPKPLPEDVKVLKNPDGTTTKIKQGIKCKVHLDGRIKLGDNVVIKDCDEDYNGEYRIIGINHQMDFYGGAWASELDLVQLGD